jgi:hypothetical protein
MTAINAQLKEHSRREEVMQVKETTVKEGYPTMID